MRIQQQLSALLVFIITTSFSLIHAPELKDVKSKLLVEDHNWIGLLETPTEVEVLYAFDTCGEQKKLLLKYFNEMPYGQTIKYKIKLQYTGYIFEEEKTKSLTANQMITGDCNSSDTSLLISLLPQWKLDQTIVSASLIEVTQK